MIRFPNIIRKTLPSKKSPMGLIAGWGDFPRLVAEAAREKGYRLVIAAVERSDTQSLSELATVCENFSVGEARGVLDILKRNGVRCAVMAGGIPKNKTYRTDFEPDQLAQKVLSQLKTKGDDQVLRAVSAVLRINGIDVINPALFLKERFTPRRVLTKRTPSAGERSDIRLGFRVAKTIGRLDVGQTVVVKNGTVLAVEALEGTDETVKRVRGLGIPGGVIVKVSKPQQDLRFDMPIVGPQTVEMAYLSNCSVLALESGKSLVLYRDETIRKADEYGISILGV